MITLGIDVGGSAVKGGLVDVTKGTLISPRVRLATPEMVEPIIVAGLVEDIRKELDYSGAIGVGFPAVIINGVCNSAANIHQHWIGMDISAVVGEKTGSAVYVLNDADAAGMAEMTFGAGRDYYKGVVIILTIGTGIGSAIFTDGHLVPNTEFGHLMIRGKDAERRASDAARKRKELSWEEWAKRLQEFLNEMERLFSPDLFIIGGGVSRKTEQFFPAIKLRAKIVPAELQNEAGIVGAAVYASQKSGK